jgi:hypothetical protein
LFVIDEWGSDSGFVAKAWRSHSEPEPAFISVAASHWQIVVTTHRDLTLLTVRVRPRDLCASNPARPPGRPGGDAARRDVHPVLAGGGTTADMIWGEHVYARLALEGVKTLASGVVMLTYRAGV